MNLFYKIHSYRRAYKNWISVMVQIFLYSKWDKKRLITVVTRRGLVKSKIPLPLGFTYVSAICSNSLLVSDISIEDGLLSFFFDNRKLAFDVRAGSPIEVFFNEEYGFLDVKFKIVVDIGANIGDSAVYFAIKGAQRVIALEPFPYTFKFANENIAKSGLSDKIEILNAGYGNDQVIAIDEEFYSDNISSTSDLDMKGVNFGRKKVINIYSLKTLTEKYKIEEGILKIDCEGCEYNLLDEEDRILRRFSMIQIEYHKGCEDLVKKFENAGFERKQYQQSNEMYLLNKQNGVGYLYLERCF